MHLFISSPLNPVNIINNEIEYVLNYAAEPYIPECFERPMHFFDINATSVLRVLNACQISKIKGLLQVSSAEIYGDMKGKTVIGLTNGNVVVDEDQINVVGVLQGQL